jgi:hypothetical protein
LRESAHSPRLIPASQTSQYVVFGVVYAVSEFESEAAMNSASRIFSLTFLIPIGLLAQDKSSPLPIQITVTAGHFYTEQAPVLTRDGLTVTQGFDEVPIVSVTAVHGALEIFLLIDHCSSCEPGTKFEELRRFIVAQPPGTSFGVAYIREGKLEAALNPTQDREAVVKAINTPEGSQPANPFTALAELIRQWPPARRVALS